MALYIAHLATGNTIRGLSVKASTIKGYLRAVVMLHKDLANIDQYLQPGVQLRFDIERNSDPFTGSGAAVERQEEEACKEEGYVGSQV